MIDYDIKSNVKAFNAKLTRIQKRQVPFATSKAINETLKEARKGVIRHIQAKQKSRKAWWNNKQTGINRKFATKKKLYGGIHTGIYWAETQEKGGTRQPRHRVFAVPTENVPKSRRKSGGAKQMLQQKTVFAGKKGIYRRIGGKKSRQVKLLFSYSPTVKISKPMLGFRKTAARITRQQFKRQHRKAMLLALKTAK